MKFSIKDLSSKCDQIRSLLWIWSHLLGKSLMENFIFCAVFIVQKRYIFLLCNRVIMQRSTFEIATCTPCRNTTSFQRRYSCSCSSHYKKVRWGQVCLDNCSEKFGDILQKNPMLGSCHETMVCNFS